MFDNEHLLVVVVTLIGYLVLPLKKKQSSFSLGAYHLSHDAPSAKLSGAGATIIFEGGEICIGHALDAGEVLAMAISCIA